MINIEKENKIADILLDFYDEYHSNEINRPMIPSIYADKILDSLQEGPANDSFEDEVKRLWKEINTGHSYSVVDSYNLFYGLCMDIAQWQKEQMMAKAVNVTISIPSPRLDGSYTHFVDSKEALPLGDIKVLVIKED